MISPDLTNSIKISIKTAVGQLGYVAEKLNEDHDPENLLLQLKAAQATLSKVIFELLDDTYRKALAQKISFAYQNCPGNCGKEELIEHLRVLFPEIPLEDVPQKLKEAETIEKFLLEIISKKNLDTPHTTG